MGLGFRAYLLPKILQTNKVGAHAQNVDPRTPYTLSLMLGSRTPIIGFLDLTPYYLGPWTLRGRELYTAHPDTKPRTSASKTWEAHATFSISHIYNKKIQYNIYIYIGYYIYIEYYVCIYIYMYAADSAADGNL